MREYTKKPENQSRTLDSNSKASRQAPIDVILQRYKERNIQRYVEDEELIQGKFESIPTGEQEAIQREGKHNNTGLPDNLKSGIENLSGYSMDDVHVHYNSDKPAQLQALAYTQGTDIHVAPGQEKHLPHEVWHVVQQKQGRVRPTTNINGMAVNDDVTLEHEADNALQFKTESEVISVNGTIQMQTFTAGTPVYAGGIINRPGTVVRFDKDSGNYIIKVEYGREVWIDRSLVTLLSKSDGLMKAKDADRKDIDAIAYSEAAQRFEMALGVCLSQYPPAVNEVKMLLGKIIQKITLTDTSGKLYGTDEKNIAGMVGTELETLEAVAASGNLRELMTMIFNIYRSCRNDKTLPPIMDAGKVAPKQSSREKNNRDDKCKVYPIVSPPLSEREKKALGSGSGYEHWESGANLFDCPMSSSLQQEANDLSIPIVADISGTAHRMLNVAQMHGANLSYMRLALLGYLIPGRQHSFHEIMKACECFGLDYTNTDQRYMHIPPLTEEQLQNVAAFYGGDRRFPHEIGKSLNKTSQTPDNVLQLKENKSMRRTGMVVQAMKIPLKHPFTDDIWEFDTTDHGSNIIGWIDESVKTRPPEVRRLIRELNKEKGGDFEKYIINYASLKLKNSVANTIDPNGDIQIDDKLIDAYRADYLTNAYLNEGDGALIANLMGICVTVYVDYGLRGFVPVITYGTGSTVVHILHTGGNHYQALQADQTAGLMRSPTHSRSDGNCLIDSIYIARSGSSAPDIFIGLVRQMLALFMSDESIENTLTTIIQDIRTGGGVPGLGPNTQAILTQDEGLKKEQKLSVSKRSGLSGIDRGKESKSQNELATDSYYTYSRAFFDAGAKRPDETKKRMINVGEAEIEIINIKGEKVPCVRLYRINSAPSKLISGGVGHGDAISDSTRNEIQQDSDGNIIISTGKTKPEAHDNTIYISVGRPDRALKWLYKYKAQKGEQANPIVRSFLVPLKIVTIILEETVFQQENDKKTTYNGFSENSDYDAAPNQLGITPKHIPLLRQFAVPNSLVSYPLNIESDAFKGKENGRVAPLEELAQKIGISDINHDLFNAAWISGKEFKSGKDDEGYAKKTSSICSFFTELYAGKKSYESVDGLKLGELKKAVLTLADAVLPINQELSKLLKDTAKNTTLQNLLKILEDKKVQITEILDQISQLASIALANTLIRQDFEQAQKREKR